MVTDDNGMEIGGFFERCRALGIPRIVLRKLYSEQLVQLRGNPYGVLISPVMSRAR